MPPLRHLRPLPTLFATSFGSSRSALNISAVRIRQPHDPAKLYFGAKVAVFYSTEARRSISYPGLAAPVPHPCVSKTYDRHRDAESTLIWDSFGQHFLLIQPAFANFRSTWVMANQLPLDLATDW